MRNQYVSPVRKRHSYKYACICIFITLILSNCPTLSMDSPSMCRLGSFSHMLCSGSDAHVIENVCKCLLQNLRHEARVQAVRDYYALRGIKKTKPACRDKFLSKEQYMKVILKAFST